MIFEKKMCTSYSFSKKVNSMWCIKKWHTLGYNFVCQCLSPTFRECLCDLRTSRDKFLCFFLERPRDNVVCQALILWYLRKIPKTCLWLELQVTISDYGMNVNVLQVNTTMALKFLPYISCSPTYSHRTSEGNFQNK